MALGGKPVVQTGAGSFPAITAADGKHTIVILAHQLRVYFLQTRQCIRTVNVDVSRAVGVFLDPDNDSQLVVFTPELVMHINWRERVEQVVVATQTLAPAVGLCDVFHVGRAHYFGAARDGQTLTVYHIDRETAAVRAVFSRAAVMHAVSEQFLAVALESAVELFAWGELDAAVDKLADAAVEVVPHTTLAHAVRPPTALAVSDDGTVAVGARSGAILLLHSGAAAPRALRWHMDLVRAVAFSRDGSYLVSGGAEKVLVFWNLAHDTNQFLPRLNGAIDRIHVDARRPDHYAVALRLDDAHEVVVVLAVDLESRLAVSPVRPAYAVAVRKAAARARRKWAKGAAGNVVAHDITAPAAVHPTTRHLYLPRGAAIQAFDLVRGEQAFVQHAAPQLSTGRVRSEHKVADPVVSHVAFSADGVWMATFDSMPALSHDNLMLKNDALYALKFWRQTPRGWELALKIVDPHGAAAVGALVAPESASSGADSADAAAAGADAPADAAASASHVFVTVDVRGGIRTWRPRPGAEGVRAQTVWTLRRATAAAAPPLSVAACFTADASVLVVAHGGVSTAYEPQLLAPLPLSLPACDLAVEQLFLAGVNLVMVAQSRIVVYDMVRGRATALAARVLSPGAGHLVAVDGRGLVAVACNTFEDHSSDGDSDVVLRSKILVMRPDSLAPVYETHHNAGVASVVATAGGFVFVDTDARVGIVAPEARATVAADVAAEMEATLVSARAAANLMYGRSEARAADGPVNTDMVVGPKLVDPALWLTVFSRANATPMDELFERVVHALS